MLRDPGQGLGVQHPFYIGKLRLPAWRLEPRSPEPTPPPPVGAGSYLEAVVGHGGVLG